MLPGTQWMMINTTRLSSGVAPLHTGVSPHLDGEPRGSVMLSILAERWRASVCRTSHLADAYFRAALTVSVPVFVECSSAWTKVPSFVLIVTQLFSLFICCLKRCNEDKWESLRWSECTMLVAGQHSAAAFGLVKGFQFKSETSITHYPTQNSYIYRNGWQQEQPVSCWVFCKRYISHCNVKNL